MTPGPAACGEAQTMNAAAIVRTIEASGGRLSIEGAALEIELTRRPGRHLGAANSLED